MTNEDGSLNDCGLWTYDVNVIPDLLANVIGAWMQDNIPSELTKAMEDTRTKYTVEQWNNNVETVINDVINEQIKSFESIKNSIQGKIKNELKEDK